MVMAMSLSRRNRIALVTGANRGIGHEIVKELAEHGLTVIMTARKPTEGRRTCGALQEKGYDVVFQQLDVTDQKSIKDAVSFVRERYGRLDVLVNNAGIFIDSDKDVADLPERILRKTMETNFFGPFFVSQAFIPLLEKSDDGRIINVSSGLGALKGAEPGHSSYSISKTALNGLTVKMAADLKGKGIKVNCMCPGWVRTDMGGTNASRSVVEGADTAVWLGTVKRIPTGRFFRDRKLIP